MCKARPSYITRFLPSARPITLAEGILYTRHSVCVCIPCIYSISVCTFVSIVCVFFFFCFLFGLSNYINVGNYVHYRVRYVGFILSWCNARILFPFLPIADYAVRWSLFRYIWCLVVSSAVRFVPRCGWFVITCIFLCDSDCVWHYPQVKYCDDVLIYGFSCICSLLIWIIICLYWGHLILLSGFSVSPGD